MIGRVNQELIDVGRRLLALSDALEPRQAEEVRLLVSRILAANGDLNEVTGRSTEDRVFRRLMSGIQAQPAPSGDDVAAELRKREEISKQRDRDVARVVLGCYFGRGGRG